MNFFLKTAVMIVIFLRVASSEDDKIASIILGNVSVMHTIPIEDSLVRAIFYFKLTNSFNVVQYDTIHGIHEECKRLKVPFLVFDDVLKFLCKRGICHYVSAEFESYTISGIRPDLQWNKKNMNIITGCALNEFFKESYFTIALTLYSSYDSIKGLKQICIKDTVMLDNDNPDFLGYIGLLCNSVVDSLHKIIYR